MKKTMTAVCLIAALLAAAGPAFALPDNEYACKVQTKSLVLGVVLVQAYDMPAARAIAAGTQATRVDGRHEGVETVLECIRFPGARFLDNRFQAFVESIPR